ncbi:MAG: helix-turn-helix transcriptional regulator [Pseudomonadota bacterium]
MSKSNNLGEFEILVLAALVRLGDRAYGTTIIEELNSRARRVVSIGALYATLARLESKGLVSSRLGDATPKRGGRAKRFYRPTPAGQEQLKRASQMLSDMLAGLPGWSGQAT